MTNIHADHLPDAKCTFYKGWISVMYTEKYPTPFPYFGDRTNKNWQKLEEASKKDTMNQDWGNPRA